MERGVYFAALVGPIVLVYSILHSVMSLLSLKHLKKLIVLVKKSNKKCILQYIPGIIDYRLIYVLYFMCKV